MDDNLKRTIFDAIQEEHRSGATIMRTIKLIHGRFDLSLAEAKVAVSSHPCWALTVNAAKPLHDTAIDIVTATNFDDIRKGD